MANSSPTPYSNAPSLEREYDDTHHQQQQFSYRPAQPHTSPSRTGQESIDRKEEGSEERAADDDDDKYAQRWVEMHIVGGGGVAAAPPPYRRPPGVAWTLPVSGRDGELTELRPHHNHYMAGGGTIVKVQLQPPPPSFTRVFVNSPSPRHASKAEALVHSPPFVVRAHETSTNNNSSDYSYRDQDHRHQPQYYHHHEHYSVVDAVPIEPIAAPYPHTSPSATSPARERHPNYGGEFLYRDAVYYATRAGKVGMVVRHADPVAPIATSAAVASSSSSVDGRRRTASLSRSPPRVRRQQIQDYTYVCDADRGIALKVIRCCVFSDHMTVDDFTRRIRINRTEARRIYESMTGSDGWCRGSPAATTASQILLHNCFGEILRGGSAGGPIDWTRWFAGVSRRRVEEAFKRTTAHVDALGLVLDRNSRGFLVHLRAPQARYAPGSA